MTKTNSEDTHMDSHESCFNCELTKEQWGGKDIDLSVLLMCSFTAFIKRGKKTILPPF